MRPSYRVMTLCAVTPLLAGAGAGTRATQAVAAPTTKCELAAYVGDPDPKGLNVRAGPGTRFPVVATIKVPQPAREAGVVTTVLGATGQWLLIEGADDALEDPAKQLFRGRGWVYAPMLATEVNETRDGSPSVPLRREPRARSAVVTRLRPGTSVTLVGCAGGWARIRSGRVEGWLSPESQCANPLTTCS